MWCRLENYKKTSTMRSLSDKVCEYPCAGPVDTPACKLMSLHLPRLLQDRASNQSGSAEERTCEMGSSQTTLAPRFRHSESSNGLFARYSTAKSQGTVSDRQVTQLSFPFYKKKTKPGTDSMLATSFACWKTAKNNKRLCRSATLSYELSRFFSRKQT